jgi:hypothetical protein
VRLAIEAPKAMAVLARLPQLGRGGIGRLDLVGRQGTPPAKYRCSASWLTGRQRSGQPVCRSWAPSRCSSHGSVASGGLFAKNAWPCRMPHRCCDPAMKAWRHGPRLLAAFAQQHARAGQGLVLARWPRAAAGPSRSSQLA